MAVKCQITGTFNRTSMELKLLSYLFYEVLWLAFNRTSMELKPKRRNPVKIIKDFSFNRTSMELKHNFGSVLVGEYILLIEPVWN